MLKAQKENGGMNKGVAGGGERDTAGRTVKPADTAPKLPDMGISKSMSSRAQAIASVPEHKKPLSDGQLMAS